MSPMIVLTQWAQRFYAKVAKKLKEGKLLNCWNN